jgi:hypothetical protein
VTAICGWHPTSIGSEEALILAPERVLPGRRMASALIQRRICEEIIGRVADLNAYCSPFCWDGLHDHALGVTLRTI